MGVIRHDDGLRDTGSGCTAVLLLLGLFVILPITVYALLTEGCQLTITKDDGEKVIDVGCCPCSDGGR